MKSEIAPYSNKVVIIIMIIIIKVSFNFSVLLLNKVPASVVKHLYIE